jgi:hypothetical protein
VTTINERHERSRDAVTLFAAPALALLLALIVAIGGLRGSDWPAHVFRVELFREVGMTLWNGQWYGGHYTLGYSVVFPPLAAWFGPVLVGVVSCVAATMCLLLLLRERYGATRALVAASWLAVGMAVNLAVGRLPFALGLAFGLLALLAYQRGHAVSAVVAALLAPLASPVAGVFLAVGIGGLVIDLWLRRRKGEDVALGVALAMGVASVAPVAITSVLFPDPGVFPFRAGAFVGVLVCCVGIAVLLPTGERVLRLAAALAAAASLPVFMMANPVGGNMTRLVVLFAVPVMVCALWRQRPRLVMAAAVPLSLWLVLPGVASTDQITDPAGRPEYHQPLVDFVTSAAGPIGRVEIPFTERHWEVAYVAPLVPIARGWERQVDMDRNLILYDPTLTVGQYRRWLHDNAVRWVALPDVTLDEGGTAEAALIERGVPGLELVKTLQHWRIWEVIDAEPIVEEPGRLVRESPDELVIAVDRPGTVLVRAWYMPYWSANGTDACVKTSQDGLLEVVVNQPGIVHLEPQFSLAPALTSRSSDGCPE